MADKSITIYEPVITDVPVIGLRYSGGEISAVEIILGLRTSESEELIRKRTVGISASELTQNQKDTLNNVAVVALGIAKTKLGF